MSVEQKIKSLVVEDNPDYLEMLISHFKRNGFQCDGVSNKETALRIVSDSKLLKKYQVLFLDGNYSLEDTSCRDGLEVARQSKQTSPDTVTVGVSTGDCMRGQDIDIRVDKLELLSDEKISEDLMVELRKRLALIKSEE